MRAALLLPLALALASCATTRLYDTAELAEVARSCRLALGEVVQFPEEPRLLFLFPVDQPAQLVCVRRWAQRRRLRLVYMESVVREQ